MSCDSNRTNNRTAPQGRITRYIRKLRLATVALFLLGLGITLYVWRISVQRETGRIGGQFAGQLAGQVRDLEFHLQRADQFLRFLAAFFASSEVVLKTEFREFCHPQMDDIPGVDFVAWVCRVHSDELLAFYDFAQSREVKNLELWEVDTAGHQQPLSTRPLYFPIVFIEPATMFGRLVGLDLSVLPEWNDLLEMTCSTQPYRSFLIPKSLLALPAQKGSERIAHRGERPTREDGVESPRNVTHDTKPPPPERGSSERWIGDEWLVFAAPVFSGTDSPANAMERSSQCQGAIVCVVDMAKLLGPIMEWASKEKVFLTIEDTSRPGQPLARSHFGEPPPKPLHLLGSSNDHERRITLRDREWVVRARLPAEYYAARRGPGSWGVLISGLLGSFLLAFYVNLLGSRSVRTEELVAQRTRELLEVNRQLEEANRRLEEEIRQREKFERNLRDSEALYSSLVENLPVHVLRKDREGRFTFANSSFCRLLGQPREAIIGKTDFDFYPPDLASKYRRDDRRVMETGELFEDIEEYEKHGETRYVQVMKSPVHDAAGHIIGVQVVFWDVTEKVAVQRALERAKEAAEEANRAKSEFLANMSHEIRTPMNAILGMAQLLEQTPLTRDQREYLQIIRESGDTLLALINSILDFSKIEAGRLELDAVEFSLREVVGDTVKALAVRAHKKHLELACRIAADVPDFLVGDPVRLRQVLINLVDNAIKFTEEGEVVVNVQPRDILDQEAVLEFSVSDTGIGIPPEKQRLIFAAFEQGDKSMTRRYGGTGLGLAICQRLVTLMGGTIELESQPGRGSTFRFTARFQIPPAAAKVPQVAALQRYGDRQILVVDDHATNRKILGEMLAHWGLHALLAASAKEALQLLEQTKPASPKVVITDVRMPEMNGYELVQELRKRWPPAELAIVVLTSEDRPGDADFFRQLDVAAVIRKPVKQSELYNILAEILGLEYHPEFPPEKQVTIPPSFTELPQLHVLLVEDSPFNQKVAIGLLEKYGHRVTAVANGREALDAIAHQSFDLVLMDIQMPEMDGLTATREIRAREVRLGLPRLPIIAMTAHALKGDREQALAAGMDGYVAKPIIAAEFFQVVADVFHQVRGVPVGETQSVPVLSASLRETPSHAAAEAVVEPPRGEELPIPGVPGRSPNGPPPDDAPTGPFVDWNHAQRATGGDRELLEALVQTFLEDMPRQMAMLEEAIGRQDWATARRAAHTMAGSFRHFGAKAAAEAAYAVEEIFKPLANGKADKTSLPENWEVHIERLRGLLEMVLQELRRGAGETLPKTDQNRDNAQGEPENPGPSGEQRKETPDSR